MKNLALFDFDGTLYKKDSLIEFTKFSCGNFKFYFGIILLSPYFFLMKLGFITNEKAKVKYLTYFFKNYNYNFFKEIATKFSLYNLNKNFDEKTFQNFQNHLKQNHTVFIVTASAQEWIFPFFAKFNVEIISTQLEIKEGKITGNLVSKNCYGLEKVNRINAVIDTHNFDNIYVYGSGKGDLEMLLLSKII